MPSLPHRPVLLFSLFLAPACLDLEDGGDDILQAEATSFLGRVVQEPGELEARFPSVIRLNDGRLMAVWHRAASHAGTVGTIGLSFSSNGGKTWSAARPALANPATMAERDTRDPKLGKMHDGAVVMTFFVPGGETYYSVWKPGWTKFTDPVRLTAPGMTRMYTHGPALALKNVPGHENQVLLPIYVGGASGGAYYVRATWRPVSSPRLLVSHARRIIAADNPKGRTYGEPHLVQIGREVVGVVRAHQDGEYSPAIVTWFNPYTDSPSFRYQSFSNIRAGSHHLLKTSDNKILFTYGETAKSGRPTDGMLIEEPLEHWNNDERVPIYNSGFGDQANPSAIELSPSRFLVLGYNAKPKSQSSNGGSLWALGVTRSSFTRSWYPGDDELLFHDRDTGRILSYEATSVGSNTGTGATLLDDYTIHNSYENTVTGDFDGDGDDELLFHNRDNGRIVVYEGTASGKHVGTGSGLLADYNIHNSYENTVAGDFDGDGDDELLFHNRDNGRIVVYEGTASGKHVGTGSGLLADYNIHNSYENTVAGDFDGDGDDELLFHNRDNGRIVVYEATTKGKHVGTGSGLLADYVISTAYENVAAGDFDGDGDDELVFHNRDNGLVLVYRTTPKGQHTGTGAGQIATFTVPIGYDAVITGDFDN